MTTVTPVATVTDNARRRRLGRRLGRLVGKTGTPRPTDQILGCYLWGNI